MVSGEGFSTLQIAGAAVCGASLVGGFIWFMDWIGRGIQETLTIGPLDAAGLPSVSDGMAEALVPEYAAARRGPKGDECGCQACRRRPTEPCSDYDGD